METKLIECRSIDVPKNDHLKRTVSREFAGGLANSIKIDGQLSPIVVRLNPLAAGRYIIVAGRHRLFAIKSILKEQFILASIDETMTEVEASMASTVENLWRNPLNKAQHALGLKQWHQHWLDSFPADGDKQTTKMASVDGESSDHSDKIDGVTLPVDPPDGDEDSKKEAAFDAKVAGVTGQAEASVRRSKAIAKAFTEDELDIFSQMETSQTDMLTIAKIKEPDDRRKIVNLIATNVSAQSAISQVMGENAPARYNRAASDGTKKANKKSAEPTVDPVEPPISDDEWFSTNCGEKAAMLGNPAKFKAGALFFRKIADERHRHRILLKDQLASTKKESGYEAFLNLVTRYLSISHPKDWLICPACKGTGVNEEADDETHHNARRCQKCFGGGYLLKTEEYL